MNQENFGKISELFYDVREMPYYVVTSPMDSLHYIEYCKKNRRGSCTPKHLYLGHLLESEGINVNYNASTFHWKDLPLDYPKNISTMIHKLSATVHLSLIFDIGKGAGKNILLDASWDSGLRGLGLTINELHCSNSGEILSMTNAVHPIDERIFNEPMDYLNYVNAVRVEDVRKKHFYYELNKWFMDVRTQNGKAMG